MLASVLFWISAVLLMYTYFFYPALLVALTMLKRNSAGSQSARSFETDEWPKVSLIITAYNEERVIARKLQNTLDLVYPGELDVSVVSDGSTDNTNSIVEAFNEHGIKLLALSSNRGKTVAQNQAVRHVQGEILVFSDANAMYAPDAITALVRGFVDSSVGCVCGELSYIQDEGQGSQEGVYWKYERFVKRAESNLWSTLGANGSIYAVRRDLYEPLAPEVISDFVEPLIVLKKGYRTLYCPEARSYEELPAGLLDDFRRKVRIVNRSCRALFFVRDLLNPVRYPFAAFALLSHKVLRWLAGLWCVLALVSNFFLLGSWFYNASLSFQLLFYILACLGYLKPSARSKLFKLPIYFCIVNAAALAGVFHSLRGKTIIRWQPSR